MSENPLLRFCRYYKGESTNPFPDPSLRFWIWEFEKKYVDESLASEDLTPFLREALTAYRHAGLSDFRNTDGVSVLMKAVLYQLFLKGNELPLIDEFVRFYDEWKKKEVVR